MAIRIVVNVLAVVIGIVLEMVFMMMLHIASTLVYPLPEGVDFMSADAENQTRLNEWFASLPGGAFLLAALCHGLGCMSGAILATLIAGRRTMIPAIIVGLFFMIGGIMNLSAIPHPPWFPIVDLPVYLLGALLAGRWLLRKEAKDTAVQP